jgi:hypothetical protein
VTDHAAVALDQLKLADDLGDTREQAHTAACTAALVYALFEVATAVREAGVMAIPNTYP